MDDRAPLVVFDLDDTLYSERTYVWSALNYVGEMVERYYGLLSVSGTLARHFEEGTPDPIGKFWKEADLPDSGKAQVIAAMHAHFPAISLRRGAVHILSKLKRDSLPFAIITDGRSITQRAKIAALGCAHVNYISISDEVGLPKTDRLRFRQIEAQFPALRYLYVGDNPTKDFVAPNQLGWTTVQLNDDGHNIHSQSGNYAKGHHAQTKISDLHELERLIDGVD